MTVAVAPRVKLVTHLIVGPADHGVVIFARWLAERTGGHIVYLPGPRAFDSMAGQMPKDAASVHLHYTEALYGPDTTSASAAFCRLRSELKVPVTVTLHDLPDPDDEPGRYARRSAGFAAVAEAADEVFVSSKHELALLQRFASQAHVVPLPMAPSPFVAAENRPRPLPEVAVFGFLYPGKGHAQLLADLSDLPAELTLTAIGRAADDHLALVQELATQAAEAGRGFSVTGFVPADRLRHRLRQVAIPVVPATAISASGSLNTWIEAGRRPLVAEGPYTQELAEAWAGAVTLYRPGNFAAAARAVLEDPALSWVQEAPPLERRENAVAEGYRNVFEGRR